MNRPTLGLKYYDSKRIWVINCRFPILLTPRTWRLKSSDFSCWIRIRTCLCRIQNIISLLCLHTNPCFISITIGDKNHSNTLNFTRIFNIGEKFLVKEVGGLHMQSSSKKYFPVDNFRCHKFDPSCILSLHIFHRDTHSMLNWKMCNGKYTTSLKVVATKKHIRYTYIVYLQN